MKDEGRKDNVLVFYMQGRLVYLTAYENVSAGLLASTVPAVDVHIGVNALQLQWLLHV